MNIYIYTYYCCTIHKIIGKKTPLDNSNNWHIFVWFKIWLKM